MNNIIWVWTLFGAMAHAAVSQKVLDVIAFTGDREYTCLFDAVSVKTGQKLVEPPYKNVFAADKKAAVSLYLNSLNLVYDKDAAGYVLLVEDEQFDVKDISCIERAWSEARPVTTTPAARTPPARPRP